MFSRFFALGVVTASLILSASAQESLQDLVTEANTEWMVGTWEATGENGETVTLQIQWDLEKHVMLLNVKTPDMVSKGITYLEPGTREAKYVSFDTRGTVTKGSWGMESDELVLRIEARSNERGPWKAGFVFTGSAAKGLQVRMHEINDSGDLVTPARFEHKFKKK